MKKFLDEYTISKIQIYKSDKSKWLPAILDKVDAKSLPKFLGGEMVDSDGNPKCESKVGKKKIKNPPQAGFSTFLL